MGIRVDHSPVAVVITLTGLDRFATGRRRLRIPVERIVRAHVAERGALERLIDHRVVGVGTHNAGRRPGRRRIGMMIGREVVGNQFWAVDKGPSDRRLLVIDLEPPVGPFIRAVVECDQPDTVATRLDPRTGSLRTVSNRDADA